MSLLQADVSHFLVVLSCLRAAARPCRCALSLLSLRELRDELRHGRALFGPVGGSGGLPVGGRRSSTCFELQQPRR